MRPKCSYGCSIVGDVAHDRHAGRVGGDDQHRRALVLVRLGVGDRHDDQEVGHRGVGGEPLVAVDDPLVAVEHGAWSASSVGSEPAVSGSVIENAERRSPASSGYRYCSFWSSVPAMREDLGVARVGRRVAEHRRRERGRAEDLVHQAELDLAEALAAEVGRQVGGPQAALLDLLLQRRDRRARSRPGRAPRRRSRSARSPRARTRASSRAAAGTRAPSRSPTPCRYRLLRVAALKGGR